MTLESLDIKQQKLQQLQQILPEIFEDGEIIPDKLRDVFGDEVNESSEHYSFTWAGKRDCYKTIREKTHATLKVDEEVANDSEIPEGENVFIEGDNLEVLKLLQLSYHKKIKMIYIDPPYNKDKDFVYSDTWGDSIHNYLVQTDQLRDKGYTTTKTNSTGRRHTNWLNMIYPRLWLSRNLLRDDGVIFVSIDDDEVHNLRKVMDEIYGEENFVASIIWEKKFSPQNDAKWLSDNHDYVLVYAKSKEIWRPYKLQRTEKTNERFSNLDNDPRGVWASSDLTVKTYNAKYDYLITTPSGKQIKPTQGRCWSVAKEEFDKLVKDNRVWFGKNGSNVPRYKTFLSEVQNGIVPLTIWKHNDVGHNQEARQETKELMNGGYFDNPKPVRLIERILRIATKEDDIILDFFAGSGTTAHAVMDLNKEDGGNRKYILVQLPEATDEKSEAYKDNLKKISDITKKRIVLAMENLKYKEGFKSFYLDKSNFQVFEEVKKRPEMSYEEIEEMLKMSMFHENILTQGAKELDIVYEVGLKNGFTLSAEVAEVKSEKYSFITLTEEERVFYFCFDKEIEGDIIHDVPKDAKLICYEKALTTNVKLNLRENLDLEVL